MPFDPEARARLLAVKGVGPTVLARLEQAGLDSLALLARQEPAAVNALIAARLGATCWRNSPQARAAIDGAIAAARAALGEGIRADTNASSIG
ncbi:Pathogenicity locus [Pseudoroseomonas deserti]|uniref:Pathogenicity locus n=1 Tax=Teichococcus deserti TaxID=1817963 RepID=A0A1V2GZF7_9PROT|nr:Pathogenicity locus [Pseudoroseomonas deserti]ONG50062.1 Pathogenicity locus [Pseudoroseomonas deserti]